MASQGTCEKLPRAQRSSPLTMALKDSPVSATRCSYILHEDVVAVKVLWAGRAASTASSRRVGFDSKSCTKTPLLRKIPNRGVLLVDVKSRHAILPAVA